jgi:acyl-CoA thioesterase
MSDNHKASGGMMELLGMKVASAADGRATITAVPLPRFYNHQGRAHGGFAATLIDTAMGVAIYTKVAEGTGFGTVDLKVTYVRRIDEATGELTCVGEVIHAGRTMLTAEAKITGADGKICAHGSGTFLVYPK